MESNSGLVFGSLIDDAVVNIAQIPEIDEFEFLVLRDGKVERLNLKKEASIESLESLGVALEPFGTADIVRAPFSMIGQMLSMPYMVFKIWISNQATGKEIVSNLQGPVGIMQLIYNVHDNGLAQFVDKDNKPKCKNNGQDAYDETEDRLHRLALSLSAGAADFAGPTSGPVVDLQDLV